MHRKSTTNRKQPFSFEFILKYTGKNYEKMIKCQLFLAANIPISTFCAIFATKLGNNRFLSKRSEMAKNYLKVYYSICTQPHCFGNTVNFKSFDYNVNCTHIHSFVFVMEPSVKGGLIFDLGQECVWDPFKQNIYSKTDSFQWFLSQLGFKSLVHMRQHNYISR